MHGYGTYKLHYALPWYLLISGVAVEGGGGAGGGVRRTIKLEV